MSIIEVGHNAKKEGAPLAQLVECRTLGGRFESHQGRGVVSLSKILHLHYLALVQPRKTSRHC